jgi:hypothetical protein
MSNFLLVVSIAAFALSFFGYRMSMKHMSSDASETVVTMLGPSASRRHFTETGLKYRSIAKWSRLTGFLFFMLWAYERVAQ